MKYKYFLFHINTIYYKNENIIELNLHNTIEIIINKLLDCQIRYIFRKPVTASSKLIQDG